MERLKLIPQKMAFRIYSPGLLPENTLIICLVIKPILRRHVQKLNDSYRRLPIYTEKVTIILKAKEEMKYFLTSVLLLTMLLKKC